MWTSCASQVGCYSASKVSGPQTSVPVIFLMVSRWLLWLQASHPYLMMPKGKTRSVFVLGFFLRKGYGRLSQTCRLYFMTGAGAGGWSHVPYLNKSGKSKRNYHIEQQNPCSDNKTIMKMAARQTSLRSDTDSGSPKSIQAPKCNAEISPRWLRAPFPASKSYPVPTGWSWAGGGAARDPGPHSWELPSAHPCSPVAPLAAFWTLFLKTA